MAGVQMGLLRSAAKATRSALRRVGLELSTHRDADRRFNGIRLSWGEDDSISTQGTVVKTTVDGATVRFFIANENDEIQREHRSGKFYEPEELGLIAKHYAGGTFLDIGSNVGNHALYAGIILKAPHLICIEPNPRAAEVLDLNLLLNGFGTTAAVHRVGLSDQTSVAHIHWSPNGNLGATRIATGSGTIPVVVGDDLICEPVSFIKIDTEGFELQVLRGLTRTINQHKPSIFVEVERQNDAGFHALIKEHGYEVAEFFQRYDESPNYIVKPVSVA
jgi:FkbM family methyltransferase